MHYENNGFSFHLPDGWYRDERNLNITFHGLNGGLGISREYIELAIGGILAEYRDANSRKEFLAEPGAEVFDSNVGSERNAVGLKRDSHTEISVVRNDVHYRFSHSNDEATIAAIERVKATAEYPSAKVAADALERASDPKQQAVNEALRAGSPEEARRLLDEVGVASKRVGSGTLHDLSDTNVQQQGGAYRALRAGLIVVLVLAGIGGYLAWGN